MLAMDIWYQFKLFVEHASGISMDALHVLVGVAAQICFAALLRRSIRSWWPWCLVLGLLLVNEASDLWVEQWPQPAMQYGEGMKDILLTMALPSLLMLCARRWPSLLARRIPSALAGNETNGG